MTDKDPKDMTVSELLREADSHPCSMCRLVMNGDESCATTGCASWAYRLADKIDAELAQARELSLRYGAELWAKANGWPDFKEGENFGQWLDRCTFAKPLDDCGEPVQFDDDTDKLNGVEKFIFLRSGGGCCQIQDAEGNICNVYPGERVKRPAPEVLGADGKPIKVGETTWGVVIGNRKPPIASVHKKGETIDGMHVKFDFVRYADGGYDWAQDLTHTSPDTQWDIDDDATMAPRDYYARYIGHDVSLKDDAEVTEAMVRDLLRRQRELDKRTGGDA